GDLFQRTAECVQRLIGVALQRDLDDHRVGEPDRYRIDLHRITLDDTFALHALDTRPARRRGKPHTLADLLQAGTRVLLQYHQDCKVEFVDSHSAYVRRERKLFYPAWVSTAKKMHFPQLPRYDVAFSR